MKNKNKHPWLDHYPAHARKAFTPETFPVHLLLARSTKRTPHAPALTFMGQTQSYDTLHTTVQRLAAGLQDMGISKGDRVALVLPNTPYYVAAYYAVLQVGATVVNVNPLYTEDELTHIFSDSAPTAIFTLDINTIAPKVVVANDTLTHPAKLVLCPLADILPPVKRTLYTLLKRKEIYTNPDLPTFNSILKDATPATMVITPEDVALLQYTGGTTGKPKGAMLTHGNITTQTQQIITWLGPKEGDPHVFMAVIPFFHVFAMTACLNLPIATGSHIIMMPRFEMKPLLQLITKYKPTIFPAVPTLFKAINAFPNLKKYDLTSLKFCVSGGAPLPDRTKHNFEKLTGCQMMEGYGLTEASPVLACNPPHISAVTGSIGLPLPGTTLSIRDPENTQKEMPQGQIGELCAKGPQIMAGYWQNDKATKDTVKYGWLKTGDLAKCDENGYFYITDRLKDVILVNGYNVYPTHIETALYKLKPISEALVIGQPDTEKGETPHAYVVLKDGQTQSEGDILKDVKKHLNPLERPSYVHVVKELPKTLIGKPCRKTLREQVLNKKEQ